MRRAVIALVASATFSLAGVAAAQMNGGSDSPASKKYMKAMQAMDDKMKGMSLTGDPNMDFVMMMTPHHQAAVDMTEAYLKYGKDPQLAQMARAIVSSQTREIKEMNAWQAKHGT